MPTPGCPVRVVATKWGERPHWEFDAVFLGTDVHGSWVGLPSGTVIARPGATVVAGQPQVVLFPSSAGFVATFYAHSPEPPVDVYVDVTTVPVWTSTRVTSVDLDLDVIRELDGRVRVDDEDEFAVHREEWDYPPDVVATAGATCLQVEEALRERRTPFDGAHLAWLAQVSG